MATKTPSKDMQKTPENDLKTPVEPPDSSQMMSPTEPQLVGEIATVQTSPFELLYDGLMRPRDATLATRGGNRGIWLYDEIERDCQVFAVMQKRKLAVVGRTWSVDAATESAADQKAADLVTEALQGFNFETACVHLLDAILKGYAVAEVVWSVQPEGFLPASVKPRDARRFVFDAQSRPRLLTWGNLMKGEALPGGKFIVHRYGAKDGNPYGLGLGTRLFWPAYFKRQGLQFWLTFSDKFGNPTVVGEYPAGASATQKSTLEDAIEAIANDTGITIPTGMKLTLLEASRSGGTNGVYDSLLKYLDDEISKAVLGEVMSTSNRAGGLNAGGAASVQNEVRLELVQSDADLLAATLNSSLVRWIVDNNRQVLGRAGYPTLYWEAEEPEDLLVRAQRDKILGALGYKPSADLVRRVYGDGYEAATPAAPTSGTSTQVALASPRVSPALQLTQNLESRSKSALKPLFDPILSLVEHAQSLEDIRDGLAKLYPDMDASRLAALMTDGMATAYLAGRFEVSAGR